MKLKSAYLHVFTYLARFVGAIWMLGGLVSIVSAIVDPERRLVYLVLGALFLVTGVALIVAKRATPADIERLKQRVATAGGKGVTKNKGRQGSLTDRGEELSMTTQVSRATRRAAHALLIPAFVLLTTSPTSVHSAFATYENERSALK